MAITVNGILVFCFAVLSYFFAFEEMPRVYSAWIAFCAGISVSMIIWGIVTVVYFAQKLW